MELKKRILLISIASVTVIIIIIVVPHIPGMYGAYSKNRPVVPNDYPYSFRFEGTPVSSVDQAKQLTNLQILTPQRLPSNLEQKLVRITRNDPEQQKVVEIYYVPKQITINENSTYRDVLDYNGIIIRNSWSAPAYYVEQSIKKSCSYSYAKCVTVRGVDGVAVNQGPPEGLSYVMFDNGEIRVFIQSYAYGTDSLIKVANSMR